MGRQRTEFLDTEGLLNPKPERVRCKLFEDGDFFDPLDLPQVRYEMLRSGRVEHRSVAKACREFGFSREYFYQLKRAFMERGLVALFGSPLGRRPLIALNQEIVGFIVLRKVEDANLSGEELRKEILQTYKVECSRRTVERVVEKTGLEKGGCHQR